MKALDLHHGDLRDVLPLYPDASFDATIPDPPYHLETIQARFGRPGATHGGGTGMLGRAAAGFMGQAWDGGDVAHDPATWTEHLRVLKPGAWAAIFHHPRTYHRLGRAVELAGFEVRDCISWLYATGAPMGNQRLGGRGAPDERGTRLKPAHELILLAMVPLEEGSFLRQFAATGTGYMNIGPCRVPSDGGRERPGEGLQDRRYHDRGSTDFSMLPGPRGGDPAGRFPPNVLLSHGADEDGYDACADGCLPGCPILELDRQSGGGRGQKSGGTRTTALGILNDDGWEPTPQPLPEPRGRGGASIFFPTFRFQAKPSRKEKEWGCDGIEPILMSRVNPGGLEREERFAPVMRRNAHNTVKPVELVRWLVRLVAPPGGRVLDAFAGSGTTGIAALREGRSFTGIELLPRPGHPEDRDHFTICRARCEAALLERLLS